MKNLGTGVMMVAAVLVAVVIVILPHNPIISDDNISDVIQTPFNPESFPNNFPNNIINTDTTTNSLIFNVNAYSSSILHSPNTQNGLEDQISTIYSPDISTVIALFDPYVENLFENSLIPGAAVVVVYQDRIVYMKTLGVKKVGENDPVDEDTLFEIGSASKAFTSAAMAALVDEGVINWENLARQYYSDPDKFLLNNSQITEEINMLDLLSHRSGLPPQAGSYHVMEFWYDFNETLFHLRYLPPESEFRTQYAYQNILYALAGYSASQAAGMTWDDLIRQKIFQPLQMNSSTTTLQEFLNNPNHASNHEINENGQVNYMEPYNLDAMGPATSISASIKDLGNWIRFQMNNGQFNGQQVVSSQSLGETHNIHIVIDQQTGYTLGYGLGWGVEVGTDSYEIMHSGSTVYSCSYTDLFLTDDLGIMVVANEGTRGIRFGQLLSEMLHNIYKSGAVPVGTSTQFTPDDSAFNEDAAFTNPQYEKLPQILNSVPLPYPIENYMGNYSSDYWGDIKIEKKNETSLLLYPGNNPNPITLNHYSGNTFNESDLQTEVTFSDFVADAPQQVVVKKWEQYGANGTFNRV
ncbi:MAG: penicillin-binding protein, beta-lactamase class C [Methanobacterium sp. Maddingley MBC34]|nr:MAG: penicillin-binding protein, beta-lactamase class C [Methanobacterium sp. Maddingley MBC34]